MLMIEVNIFFLVGNIKFLFLQWWGYGFIDLDKDVFYLRILI